MSARKLTAETSWKTQVKYKLRKTESGKYRFRQWVLIKFLHEESAKQKKLFRPWHGPYRIAMLTDTDITALNIYFPEDGYIKVHQSQVFPVLLGFQQGTIGMVERNRVQTVHQDGWSISYKEMSGRGWSLNMRRQVWLIHQVRKSVKR